MEQGSGLDFKAKVDFTQAKKDIAEFEKTLAKLGVATSNATAKSQNTSGNANAHVATMDALKAERLAILEANRARAEANAEIAKNKLEQQQKTIVDKEALAVQRQLNTEMNSRRPTQVSNSQTEVDAYNNLANGARDAATALNEQDEAQAAIANSATAAGTAVAAAETSQRQNNITRERSNYLLEEERYRQQQSTREVRNSVRENNNAQGSLEQRRAALIRLTTAYDRLSATERASPSGQRLQGIVTGLTAQVQNLETATGRAQRNVGNYGSALGTVWSGLKSIANLLPGLGIAGLIGLAVEPLIEYVKNLEIFKKSAKDLAKNVALSSNEYKSAISDVSKLKVAVKEYHDGILTGTQLVKIYNDGIGKTAGNLQTVTQVEKFYNSKTSDYIEAMSLRSQANEALRVAVEKTTEAQQRAADGNTFLDYLKASGDALTGLLTFRWVNGKNPVDEFKDALANFKARDVAELKKGGSDAVKVFEELQKKSDEFNKKNKIRLDSPKDNSGEYDAALKRAEDFSEKLTKLHRDASRKTMDSDDAEIQAVKDKYKTFTEEAEKFYNNSKNKGLTVKLNGVNISKSQVFGTLKADERAEIDAIEAKREADKRKKEQEEIKKHYDKLLNDFMDYGQKRDKLQADFDKDRLLLINDPRQLEIRKQQYEKDLKELSDVQVKSLPEFAKLFDGINNLSDESARTVIGNAKKMLETLLLNKGITGELYLEIKELLAESEAGLKDRLPARLIDLANQIDRVVESIGGMDTAFGKVLSTVSNVVGQVGNIKKGISDFKSAGKKDDVLGQLGAGLGIFGAGVSIFKTVFSLFDRSKQREEQEAYARDLQNKQTEAVNKALERQISLVNDAYGTDRILKYAEAQKAATETEKKYQDQLAKKFALTGDNVIDKMIAQINNGEQVTGDIFAVQKLKKALESGLIKQLGDLSKMDVGQLQNISENTILDESTAKILDSLIKAKQAAIDLQNQLNAENVGSTLSQQADDFIKTLTDGTQDFGKSFEDTIRTSIMNGFKGRLIEQQLQAFYTQFAELSTGGLTADEIETLRTAYTTAAEKAKKDIEDLEKATGVKLTGDTSTAKKTGLSGTIVGEALKEDTANRMLGIDQGIYDLTKQNGLTMGQMLQIGQQKLAVLQRIELNTKRGADNTDGHTDILNKIAENTAKPSPSSSDPLGQSLRDAGLVI